jgi:quercetin dioxygenase-like cupin family protein
MEKEEAYSRAGHTARTLVREPDLRIVLIAMREGSWIAEHSAADTASVHVLSGHMQLRLPDKTVDLRAGHLLVLPGGLRHDVEAVAEGVFLLTLGWQDS